MGTMSEMSRSSALARALVLAALLPLLALAAGTSSAGSASAASSTVLRFGTWNVQVRRPASDFGGGLVPLLQRTDLVALQEVDTYDKEQLMQAQADAGWSYYRARPGLQEPVMWRTDRFAFVGGRVEQISAARWVGSEAKTSAQHARTDTIVRLVDKVTGRRVSVINVHLVSGAIRGGRPWYHRPRLFGLYREGLVNVMRQILVERKWGTVFVAGDFNSGWVADRKRMLRKLPIRTMAGLGMRSAWAVQRPTNGLGTHNDALIDQVFSAARPSGAWVQFDLSSYSDHRPAVVWYP
jgi:endonuclease/exonuclease/phosphatase (EEP) superfamily protein YafD